MQFTMLRSQKGAANPPGSKHRSYKRGETYSCDEPWLHDLGRVFVAMEAAQWTNGVKDAGPAPENRAIEAAPENRAAPPKRRRGRPPKIRKIEAN